MAVADLWEISVITSAEAEEAVSALLERLLACSPTVFWDAEKETAAVSVYTASLACPQSKLKTVLRIALGRIQRCGLKTRPGTVAVRRVRREDWAESWKRHFHTIEISHALLIRPGWSRRRARSGQAVVVLDPGLSFGTGHHPTTAFCLEQLVARRRAGLRQSCLDIGTGSGILAIAAAKLGYSPVAAFDSDPAAVRVAKANALKNRVSHRIRIGRKDLLRLSPGGRLKFDVICANLTCDLLLGQSKRILASLRPGGALILAGILRAEFGPVKRCYAAAGLELVATRHEREWQSAAFVSPGTAK